MICGQLVVKNILRNRRRSLLTAMSVAVSIFLPVIFAAESIPIELSIVFLHPLAVPPVWLNTMLVEPR